MQRDDNILIRHILDAAHKALSFTENRVRQDLDTNEMLGLALVTFLRSLEKQLTLFRTIFASTTLMSPGEK